MQSLPLVTAFLTGLLVVPATLTALRGRGAVRANHRGAPVAFPGGLAIVAAGLVALLPLAITERVAGGVFAPDAAPALIYVLGVAALGWIDDLAGSGASERGWRGHARATATGRLSTGALKAAGALGLALFVLSPEGRSPLAYALAVLLLVLATNLFNLLDRRPGRSLKALVLLGAGLTLGTLEVEPLWALGLFLGPMLVMLPLDLRERGMLGDTGSNAVGAVAGLWLVLTLPAAGQAAALALILVITVYGEFRSISSLIERVPLLRQLDSLGRTKHA